MNSIYRRLIRFSLLALRPIARAVIAIDDWRSRTFGTPEEASRLCSLASLEIEKQEWERASFLAGEAILADPGLGDAYSILGYAHQQAGNIDQARQAFSRGLLAAPDDHPIPVRLGDLELAQEQDSAAEAAYRRALVLQPMKSDVLRALAQAVGNQERIDEAGSLLERALALAPGDTQVLTFLGLTRYRQGNHLQAMALLNESIERERGQPNAHYYLARALAELGRLHEAVDSARRAVRLDPENVRFRVLYKSLYRRANPLRTGGDFDDEEDIHVDAL